MSQFPAVHRWAAGLADTYSRILVDKLRKAEWDIVPVVMADLVASKSTHGEDFYFFAKVYARYI